MPTQELPPWLSASTSWITTGPTPIPTTYVVPLPLTYYGPAIPLDPDWVWGGSTSPPPGVPATPPTLAPASTASATAATTIGSSTIGTTASSITPSTSATSAFPTSSASTGSSSVSSASISQTLPNSSTTSSVRPTGSLQPGQNLSSKGLSNAAVIAIATSLSIVGFLLLLCCLAGLFIRRRRREQGRYRNGGRPLEGDTSMLPPGPDERPLLDGRRDGGESPMSPTSPTSDPEMAQVRHLPIARSFISMRKKREAEGGEYAPVATTVAEAVVGTAAMAALGASGNEAARADYSGSGHGSEESRHTASSHPGSGSWQDVPPSPVQAEFMVAQRATRSPLARLARLSWFARNRATLGTSMAATAGTEEESPRRDLPENRRLSADALLASPGAGPSNLPHRAFGSAAALIPSPPSSPPPMSFLNVPKRQSLSRADTGETVYYDAPSRPMSAQAGGVGTTDGSQPRDSMEPDSDTAPGPTSADFPPVPTGEVPWPRFGAPNDDSPGTATGSKGSDPLDIPAPGRYVRSAASTGQLSTAATGLAKGWVPDERDIKRLSAPEAMGSRGILASLDDGPPTATAGLTRPLGGEASEAGASSKRLTLGPSSFVDVPRVVTQPDIASLHGDTYSRYGRDSFSGHSGPGHHAQSSISSGDHLGLSAAAASLTPFSSASGRPSVPELQGPPSLSAIRGGAPRNGNRDTFGPNQGSSSRTGTNTGTSQSGSRSSGAATENTSASRATSEYGEIVAPGTALLPPRPIGHLPGVSEGQESTVSASGSYSPPLLTPPPAPPTGQKYQPLSPRPPGKPWWKP